MERDRGWGAVQNCYPIAMEPLDGRNGDGGALVLATTSLWRAGLRGGAVERWGRRTASVAAVGLVEALRVANAMLCI